LIVGLLNVTEKETNSFLIATIALLSVAGSIGPIEAVLAGIPGGDVLVMAVSGFLAALVAFVSPGAFVVALKAIKELAQAE